MNDALECTVEVFVGFLALLGITFAVLAVVIWRKDKKK